MLSDVRNDFTPPSFTSHISPCNISHSSSHTSQSTTVWVLLFIASPQRQSGASSSSSTPTTCIPSSFWPVQILYPKSQFQLFRGVHSTCRYVLIPIPSLSLRRPQERGAYSFACSTTAYPYSGPPPEIAVSTILHVGQMMVCLTTTFSQYTDLDHDLNHLTSLFHVCSLQRRTPSRLSSAYVALWLF